MLEKITPEELVGKGVIGLDDTPKLAAPEMQQKFEETAREVIIPKFNELIEALAAETGANEIGASDPVTGENVTVQRALESLLKATVHTVVQDLTEDQKARARANIEAASATAVKALEEGKAPNSHAAQKETYGKGTGLLYGHVQLRDNPSEELDETKGAAATPKALHDAVEPLVSTEAQSMAEEKKAQARANIGAVNKEEAAAAGAAAVDEKYFDGVAEVMPETSVVCDEPIGQGAGAGYRSFKGEIDFDGGWVYDEGPKTAMVRYEDSAGVQEVECQASYRMFEPGSNWVYYGNEYLFDSGRPNTGEDFLLAFRKGNFKQSNLYSRRNETVKVAVSKKAVNREYLPRPADAVTYTAQTLTEEQKAQARTNIGAVSTEDVQEMLDDIPTGGGTSVEEALEAVAEKYFPDPGETLVDERTVQCQLVNDNGVYYYGGARYCDKVAEVMPETVVAVINGVQHTVGVAYSYDSNGNVSNVYIGNRSLSISSYPDTGEDFLLYSAVSAGGVGVTYSRTQGDITFSVYMIGGVLADEYLDPLVLKAKAQTLTDAQKAQARENIGAAAVGEGGGAVGGITWDDIGTTYGDTATFAGNPKESANVMGVIFKISDATPTYDELLNGYAFRIFGEWNEVPIEEIQQDLVELGGIIASSVFFVCPPEMVGVTIEDMGGVAFPEQGTYVMYDEMEFPIDAFRVNGYTGFASYAKIDEKYLPLDKIGGVANWDAQDGEPGYMLNKPFGHVYEVIFPETVFQAPADGTGAILVPQKMPSNGGVYNVVWNGVKYECLGYDAGGGVIVLYYVNGPDAAPFSIMFAQGICSAAAKDGSTSVTLEIISDYDKKIDRAFLPEGGADAVTYTAQELTVAQKQQARTNIGAASANDLGGRAPKNHASPNSNYGIGSENNYGHVKLSDSLVLQADAGSGWAATPMAVFNVNKLAKDSVKYTEQTLTSDQKAQVQKNIGLENALLSTAQTLTDDQKAQAKKNIGLEDVLVATAQTLSGTKKQQARKNIGAFGAGEISWNDVGKSGDTLVISGGIEGRPTLGEGLYKVSDAVPTREDFQKGGAFIILGNKVEFTGEEFNEIVSENNGIMVLDDLVIFVPHELAGVEVEGIGLIPESGIYTIYVEGPGFYVSGLQIFGYTGFEKDTIPSDRLQSTGVTAGTYGGLSSGIYNFPVVTVDEYGRITSASVGMLPAVSSKANGYMPYGLYNHINLNSHIKYATGVVAVDGETTILGSSGSFEYVVIDSMAVYYPRVFGAYIYVRTDASSTAKYWVPIDNKYIKYTCSSTQVTARVTFPDEYKAFNDGGATAVITYAAPYVSPSSM